MSVSVFRESIAVILALNLNIYYAMTSLIFVFQLVSATAFAAPQGSQKCETFKNQSARLSQPPTNGYYWPFHKKGLLADETINGIKLGKPPLKKLFGAFSKDFTSQDGEGRQDKTMQDKIMQEYIRYRDKRVSSKGSTWPGHCDQTAFGSIILNQLPEQVRVNGTDFTREDILGLAAWASFYEYPGFKKKGKFNRSKSKRSNDIKAHFFHKTLTGKIAKKDESFMLDRDPGPPIFFYPVRGYEFDYRELPPSISDKPLASADSKKIDRYYQVTTRVEMSEHHNYGQKGPTYETYKYVLGVDKNGCMVDSKWISKNEPDYILMPKNYSVENYRSNLRKVKIEGYPFGKVVDKLIAKALNNSDHQIPNNGLY